ncbi:MAG: hypothetical protein DRQ46_09975 [Gammaproteobacteria bacterium]|nr:MAG: hypothetical protein DRQ46_09975 [Gammaproteobacteria bacterium]
MTPVKRYMETKCKLKMINDILEKEEYVGAGLSIGLTVGPVDSFDGYDLGIEIADPSSVCKALVYIRDGLVESLKSQEFFIRNNHEEVRDFLTNLDRE